MSFLKANVLVQNVQRLAQGHTERSDGCWWCLNLWLRCSGFKIWALLYGSSALNVMATAEKREDWMIKVRDHQSSHSLTQQKAALERECVCVWQLMQPVYCALVRISRHRRLLGSKTCYLLVLAGWQTGLWTEWLLTGLITRWVTSWLLVLLLTTDWHVDWLVWSGGRSRVVAWSNNIFIAFI